MNRESFKATVEDADILDINEYLGVSKDYDIDTGKPTVYVNYELEPEAREWGIKSIYVFVSRVQSSIEWSVDGEDFTEVEKKLFTDKGGIEGMNGYIEGLIEIDTFEKLNGKDWDINTDIEFKSDGGFQIDNCEINLNERSINLT